MGRKAYDLRLKLAEARKGIDSARKETEAAEQVLTRVEDRAKRDAVRRDASDEELRRKYAALRGVN